MITIKPDELAKVLMRELQGYSSKVADETKAVCKRVARQATQEIKSGSPKRTGNYSKGWKTKTLDDGMEDTRIVIHNATSYQLTHLLENGHSYVGRNGKRVAGAAKAHPHIAIVEEKAVQELSTAIERIVKG